MDFVRQNKVLVGVAAGLLVLALVLSIVALAKKPKVTGIRRVQLLQFSGDSLQPGPNVTSATITNSSGSQTMTGALSAFFFIPTGSTWGSGFSYVGFTKGDGTNTLMFGSNLPANQSTIVTLAPGETATIQIHPADGFTLGQNGLIKVFWTQLGLD